MIDKFIGITGNNKGAVTKAIEDIINKTDARIDQENVQMNILINNDNLLDNCKKLINLGSKEILVIGSINKDVEKKLGIKLLSMNDLDYIVKKYRNDNYE